jgi:ribosomal protein S18 acetylase RimI-like enzyme
VLARAFHDDPAWTWIVPSADRRARMLPRLFHSAISVVWAGGRVDTTAGEPVGVALWVPPGEALVRVTRAARRAYVTMPLRLLGAYGRFRDYTEWNYEVQRRAHPGPSLFLSGLGVDPAHRGRGVASALLEAGLAREPGATAVLLTNNARNIPLYERHGFEVVLDEPMPQGLPTWAMVRRPG